MILYTPNEMDSSIRLDEAGIYSINNGKVYTTGVMVNYLDGANMIQFRIEGMDVGNWQIEYLPSKTYNDMKVDLWLADEALNPNVTLIPSSPFITLGSNASINRLLSVGGYDSNNRVVLASSGRGYNWIDEIVPFCIMKGTAKILTDRNTWYAIEGSVVSASFLAGIIAILYDKWKKEKVMPLANSLIIRNWLLNYLERFQGVEYPNTSQGYGILRLKNLSVVLGSTY